MTAALLFETLVVKQPAMDIVVPWTVIHTSLSADFGPSSLAITVKIQSRPALSDFTGNRRHPDGHVAHAWRLDGEAAVIKQALGLLLKRVVLDIRISNDRFLLQL